MLTIERRIAALEASASDDSMKIIVLDDCETQTAALKRAGLMLMRCEWCALHLWTRDCSPPIENNLTNSKPAACGFSFVWC